MLAVSPLLLPTSQAATLHIASAERITPVEAAPPRPATGLGVPGRREVRFEAFGRRFEIDLEANVNLAQAATPGVELMKGTVRGLSGSWVRLTRRNGRWSGLVYDGAEYFGIDDASRLATASDAARDLPATATVIYRWRDAVVEGSHVGDVVVPPGTTLEEAAGALALDAPATAHAEAPVTRRLEVGVVVDSAQVERDGGEANALALAADRLNVADGILAAQTGIALHLASSTAMTSTDDPFDSSDPGTLLEQVRDWRKGSEAQGTTGLTHLFTGKDLDGQTVGIAYISSICDRTWGASLSEARSSVDFGGLVAAHEIGHALGAPHDAEAGSACEAAPPGHLMGTQLSLTSPDIRTLSACSVEKIAAVVSAARCLTVVEADVAVGAPTNAEIAVNQPSLLQFSVRSTGSGPATNVVFDLALPPGLGIVAGGATGNARCTLGSTSFHCEFGDLPSGAVRDIEVQVRATAEGTLTAQATVSADNDTQAFNDNALVRLTALPGADLGVSVRLGSASLLQGETTTATINLRNDGLSAVDDARLVVTLDEGLMPVGASGTGISCTVESGAVACLPAILGVGATAQLSLTLQAGATATGPHRLRLRLDSASRMDPQPVNNQATVTADISAPPPPPTPSQPATPAASSGGGGGRLDGALLGVLGLTLLAALRLRRAQDARPSAARKYFSR